MFEQLLSRPFHIARHRGDPYSDERQRYLAFLTEEGRSRSTLRAMPSLLYSLAQFLPMDRSAITPAQVKTAAERWAGTLRRSTKCRHAAETWFIYHAKKWLRLLGRLHEEAVEQPFSSQLEAFLQFEAGERGLSPATLAIETCQLRRILTWLSERHKTLTQVNPDDISHYFSAVVAQRRWKRTTISLGVNAFRNFFRFAESRHWCVTGLAATIDAPRIYHLERVPRGPKWSDVQRLMAASRGDTPTQIRDHAILSLLVVYGFRSGEVRLLRLEDIDWEKETVYVRRSKQRKSQRYPLVREVGDAILRYLRKVRPRCREREVFLTLKQPYGRLSSTGFGTMVRKRLHRLGRVLPCYGPHALRHACATHLLAEGFSLKEIGDHLGHVSPVATQMYAKVDLTALREVGQIDLRGLADYAERSARAATPIYPRGSISALRAVAAISLGGLA
jgi:integrase/recombinase XerD